MLRKKLHFLGKWDILKKTADSKRLNYFGEPILQPQGYRMPILNYREGYFSPSW